MIDVPKVYTNSEDDKIGKFYIMPRGNIGAIIEDLTPYGTPYDEYRKALNDFNVLDFFSSLAAHNLYNYTKFSEVHTIVIVEMVKK